MSKRRLTPEEKEKLVVGRLQAREDRERALQLLRDNKQITNPRFWERVDSETLLQLEEAMHQARVLRKLELVQELESKLEKEKRELEELEKRGHAA